MKYRFFIHLLLIAYLPACSVNVEDDNQPNCKGESFHAWIEDVPTRVFADDQLRVLWNADDRITIFNKNTYNQEYLFSGQDGDNSGSFKKVESGNFVTGNTLDYAYSVYPYQESTVISNDGVITVFLPSQQAYLEDSFGKGANTMIAITQDNDLLFRNLCGYLAIKLYGDNVAISSISIKGNNNEPLAGKASVNASIASAPAISFDSSASKEITMTFGNPVSIGSSAEKATPFWFVIPPTTFSKGFTVTVKDNNNRVFQKSTTKSFDISRNALTRMAALEVVPDDSTIEEISIQINKAGTLQSSLSEYDLSKVKSVKLSGVLNDIDFLYIKEKMTGLDLLDISEIIIDEIPILFKSWSCKEFILPKSLQRISNRQFENSKLSTVIIGDSLIYIGEYAFHNSTIETIVISENSNLKAMGVGVFQHSSLKSFLVPPKLEVIPQNAFYSCGSFSEVQFADNCILKEIQNGAFANYEYDLYNGITEITIPKSVRIIGKGAFELCTKLRRVYFEQGSTLESIGVSAFSDSGIRSITIPAKVNRIEQSAFYSCEYLTEVVFEKPSSLTFIGAYSFALYITSTSDRDAIGQSKLKEIEIPASVTEVGNYAFNFRFFETISFEEGSGIKQIGPIVSKTDVLDASKCKQLNLFYDRITAKVCLLGTTTPPTIKTPGGDIRMNGQNIHGTILKVPKTALGTYKKSDWAKCFESISALDE